MTSTESKISHLRGAVASSPEYADIVPFFIGLYEYISGREDQTGITLRPRETGSPDRIDEGTPLISSEDLRVDREQNAAFIAGLIDLLSRAGREGQADLARIGGAAAAGSLDPALLYAAILDRKRSVLDEAAVAADVPPPLIEYLFEIPLRTALELAASNTDPEVYDGWEKGNCPFCGSRAGMAELTGEGGQRHLSCTTCGTRWPFRRIKCPYCGTEDAEKLSYFTAGDGSTRVDTCKGCSRYIKTRDSRTGGDDAPLEIVDLLTIHLDLLASREGFERGK